MRNPATLELPDRERERTIEKMRKRERAIQGGREREIQPVRKEHRQVRFWAKREQLKKVSRAFA